MNEWVDRFGSTMKKYYENISFRIYLLLLIGELFGEVVRQ